jgi:acetoin utilization deacetylase AcuC-like enzyme
LRVGGAKEACEEPRKPARGHPHGFQCEPQTTRTLAGEVEGIRENPLHITLHQECLEFVHRKPLAAPRMFQIETDQPGLDPASPDLGLDGLHDSERRIVQPDNLTLPHIGHTQPNLGHGDLLFKPYDGCRPGPLIQLLVTIEEDPVKIHEPDRLFGPRGHDQAVREPTTDEGQMGIGVQGLDEFLRFRELIPETQAVVSVPGFGREDVRERLDEGLKPLSVLAHPSPKGRIQKPGRGVVRDTQQVAVVLQSPRQVVTEIHDFRPLDRAQAELLRENRGRHGPQEPANSGCVPCLDRGRANPGLSLMDVGRFFLRIRQSWRLLGRRGNARVRFFYHPAYRRGLTGVPMDALRGERVLSWLEESGWLRPEAVRIPEDAPLQALLRVHTPEYLRALEQTETVSRVLGLPLREDEARAALAMQRVAAGGTLEAARFAIGAPGIGFHLGGGFHHARQERGGAFCLLHDVAIAIRTLREEGFDAPILVVDLDLHDGDGTRILFARDPSVHTYSIHNETWAEDEAVADTRLPMGAGVQDAPYLETLERTLPPVIDKLEPGLVFYLAGVDAMAGDAFGDGVLSQAGLFRRDTMVTRWVRDREPAIPMVVLLSGGYGPRAWRPTARFAGWILSGERLEPPHDVEVALSRALRGWHPPEPARSEPRAASSDDPFAWSLDADDLVALGGVDLPAVPNRLGLHSHAQVQEALERFGILPQLRNRGYSHPLVELVPGSVLGPVVRVWGEAERAHLLMEIRLDEDRRTLPGYPLLRVEWLLLQDPRAHFTPLRPPLPGQDHPGLGALADVMAWLVYLCQSMGLDGILFRTPHWHLAVLAHRHVHFLSQSEADRFDSGIAAMEGRSLAEVANRPDIHGWSGEIPMILPVGDKLLGRTFMAAARLPSLPPRDFGRLPAGPRTLQRKKRRR